MKFHLAFNLERMDGSMDTNDVVRHMLDLVHTEQKRSLELFCNEVIPAFPGN